MSALSYEFSLKFLYFFFFFGLSRSAILEQTRTFTLWRQRSSFV